jgi:hypothetical protein
MTDPKPKRRWYHLTPDRFFVALLAVQVLLLLSERFQRFPFNEHKGWTVLIAVGVVGMAVLVMSVWGLVCLCFRWRFQFGIWSLLVFLLALSVPLGWFAWEMQRARKQTEAVTRIAELGGEVDYDYQPMTNPLETLFEPPPEPQPTTPAWLRKLLGDDLFRDVVSVRASSPDFGDEELEHVSVLTKLEGISLPGSQVTNAGLEHVKGLSNLKFLSVDGTQITDAGLEHLKGLSTLKRLFLSDTPVTDAGLDHLTRLTELETLVLQATQVTDAGLVHVSRLTKLKMLVLQTTHVTDAGLEHLSGMASLKEFYLGGSQVTDEGVEKLRQALPNCRIYHDRP